VSLAGPDGIPLSLAVVTLTGVAGFPYRQLSRVFHLVGRKDRQLPDGQLPVP